MLPSKRSSLASHHTSLPSIEIQPGLETQRMEKYIQFIRITILKHLKDRQFTFQQTELKELHKLIKTIQQNYIKSQKENQTLLTQLRSQNDQIILQRDQEIKKITATLSQQFQQKNTQFNQKILSLNNEHGRKQQTYRQIIQKMINALTTAQKNHQQAQTKLNSQLSAVTKIVQKLIANRKRDQHVAVAIKDIIQQIALRQQNSLISSKPDQLSLDQIVLPNPHPLNHQNCESALILDQFPQASLDKQLQNCLIKLVCFGLFEKANEECLRKMIAFTANYDQPTELLQEKVFPVMMEVLTSNMRKHQDQAERYLQGSPGGVDGEENSRVELRNINNLSELSINTLSEMSINERM